MKIVKTNLEGVLLIEPPTLFKDLRGGFVELYNELLYKEAGITADFIQDDISFSSKNVLRGIHGDNVTWKLVSCLYGEIFFVVLNHNKDSREFGKWQSMILSQENRLQVLIPPGFGNGHLVLSQNAIFHYKQSTYYDRSKQFTILWNDPKLNIPWPIKNPIVSLRDKGETNG